MDLDRIRDFLNNGARGAFNAKPLRDLIAAGAGGGLVLMGATALALIVANSPLYVFYEVWLQTPVAFQVGALAVDKPLLLWINDGLMAIFFLLIGLELKRELLHGELSDMRQVILPGVGAIGGMAVPALIYVAMNWGDSMALQGWAIPAATDIAFALGILMLLGARIPISVKLFLVTLAIFDDVGAIIIIAVFYTDNLSGAAFAASIPCFILLAVLNRMNVQRSAPYILVGIALWLAALKSGVHATLAGVILAAFIPSTMPTRGTNRKSHSLLEDWEHGLQNTVAYIIVPVFAFANAGLVLSGLGMDDLLHPVSLGIAAGLFVGKQVGVFGFCWAAIRLGWTQRPDDMTWAAMYGAAILSGIGFTMSLFIGGLAFSGVADRGFDERLGILVGSFFSAVVGYFVLRKACPDPVKTAKPATAAATPQAPSQAPPD
ncbi:MAG: Na+/H+ antiporter NhaA [Oceanococcaceae bacterium]